MVPKDKFGEWEASLSNDEKNVLDEAADMNERTILGIDCVEYSRAMGHDEGMFEYCDDMLEDEDPYDVWERMMGNLPEGATYIYI
jgi:hypothetical protein